MKNCLKIFIIMVFAWGSCLYSQSWNSNGPYFKNIKALSQVPLEPGILYAGAFGSGVFKSTNGGTYWNNVKNGMSNTYVRSILAISDSIVFAGTNDGVFKTTNAGSFWISSLPTANSVRYLAYDYKVGTLYAATYGSGLYKSNDQGMNWSSIQISDPNTGQSMIHLWAVAVYGRDSLYVGGSISDIIAGGALFKSSNGGMNWSQVQYPTGIRSSVKSIAISPDNPESTLIIGTAAKGVYQSENGGLNWIQINAGSTPNPLSDLKINTVGFNSNFRYAGTDSLGKFYYRAVGDTITGWLSGSGLPGSSAVVNAIEIDSIERNIVYLGTGGQGVFKSNDFGFSWQSNNDGMLGVSAHSVRINGNGDIIVGTDFGDGIWISTNKAESWNHSDSLPTSNSITAIGITNTSTILYAASYGAGVFKSSDGGYNWQATEFTILNPYVRSLVVNPSNSNIVYAGTDNGVYKTTNGGTNWFAYNNGMPPQTSVRSMEIDPINSDLAYAGTDSNYMYKTTNAGTNWIHITNLNGFNLEDRFIRSITLDPIHSNNIYVGTDSGRVYKSTDFGIGWNLFAVLPTTHSVRSILINPNFDSKILFAGTFGNGIFVSIDSGYTWSPFNTGLTDLDIYSLASDKENPLNLYAGTGSNGVFHTTYFFQSTGMNDQVQTNRSFELHQNFPNPFNPSTKIKYSVPQSSKVVIKVFDVLGKEAATLVNEEKPVGSYEVTWNASGLPSGVYFYRIKAGNFIQTKKMLLLK